MKTLTEFSGFVLKEMIAKKAALLTEGKTEEEASVVINELLKLDETKVSFYKNAVDMTNSRRDQVKRVVVAIKATETEKVPDAFIERDGHFYLLEYFNTGATQSRDFDSRGGRNDSRGGRGKGGGGDRGRGNDRGNDRGGFGGDRPPQEARPAREPREQRPPNPNAASFVSTGEGKLAPRAHTPRPPRQQLPKGPRIPRGPKGAGELRLVLKGESATTLQGSGPAISPDAVPAQATEAPQA